MVRLACQPIDTRYVSNNNRLCLSRDAMDWYIQLLLTDVLSVVIGRDLKICVTCLRCSTTHFLF